MTVAVVIPTRNRARFLPAAIASALRQTHEDIELVVVDDASDDETPRLLADLARADPRLRVVRNERPVGAAAARNMGVAQSRAPLVAFLDDDCVWAPDKLERQVARLGSGRGAAYCRQAIRGVSGEWIVEGGPGAEDAPLDALLGPVNIGAPTLLVRRDVYDAVGGFDERLPRLQDWDLALRLARHTRFAFEPGVLVRGVQVELGISARPETLRATADRIIASHAPHLTRRQLARLHYRLGKFLLAEDVTAGARRLMLASLRLAPRSAFGWAGVAAAMLGPRAARRVRSVRRRRAARAAGVEWETTAPSPGAGAEPGSDG